MPTNTYPKILHHGGADGVTGSCHRLQFAPDRALLVDCGLFQGQDAEHIDHLEQHRVRFPVDDVLALIVTHVHIDHIGRLPYLLAAGYKGPIICSVPSARLLPLVIEDALKIGFTRDSALIKRFLEEVNHHLVPLDYKSWHTVVDDKRHRVRVRLQRAGHILGSAWIEVDFLDRTTGKRERTVFSGDLGAPYAPLLPAPKAPYRADRVILESTYGDRQHEDRKSRRLRLKAAIDHSLANAGTVIIPAFSIGRTQELLYELEGLIRQGRGSARWKDLEIIIDSPLAARFTAAYRDLKPWWDAEAHVRLRHGRHPLSFDNLYTVDTHEEHLKTVNYLVKSGRPAVVLAASGMATGGRVVNYLKRMLGEERHAVLFTGYQAAGTPGRAIQQYGPRGGWVELDGQRITIRAHIETIGGYSAHADQANLLRFITCMRHWPREVRLIHGESNAQEALKARLEIEAARRGHEMQVIPGHLQGRSSWSR